AAIIDHESAASAAIWNVWDDPWGSGSFALNREIAERPKRQRTKRRGAEPIWCLGRCQRAKDAHVRASAMTQGQEYEFEVERCIRGAVAARAREHTNGFPTDNHEQFLHQSFALARPQSIEGLALELAAEGRAHPRARDPERMACAVVVGQNEG